MAKVKVKAEEITEVTLNLSKAEAEAVLLLVGRCAPGTTGNVPHGYTAAVHRALGNAGIKRPAWANDYESLKTVVFSKKDEGENCVAGMPGCDCKTTEVFDY